MHIVIMAFGSRGDVQPYVALGHGLKAAGHGVTVAALDDYETLIREAGLDFFSLGFRMADMQLDTFQAALDSGRNTVQAVLDLLRSARPVMTGMMARQGEVARQADALIASLIAMIPAQPCAEKFGIPYMGAVLQPLGHTRAFPSPVFPVDLPPLGALNWLTHRFEEQLFALPTWPMVNHFRRTYLGLPPIRPLTYPYTHLNGRAVPWLHAYSPAVVPHPADWPAFRHVTGYWTLPPDDGWLPPADLVRFLDAGPQPVYAGFGSMAMQDNPARLALVIEALDRAGQRGVLAVRPGEIAGHELPETVYPLMEGCPHEWLFPKMAAIVHHGGAGTTGAGLRSGAPSIGVPFMGDQPFWASRIAALGAGPQPIPRKQLTAGRLAYAIRVAVEHEGIRRRAAALGEKLRAEDGVGSAVRIIQARLAAG